MRNFELIDVGEKVVGTFHYNPETQQYSMAIDPTLDPWSLPMSLYVHAANGRFEVDHDATLRWVRQRICPPSRHNIIEILRKYKLPEYDEFGLLMVTMAHSDKDDLYLREIT